MKVVLGNTEKPKDFIIPVYLEGNEEVGSVQLEVNHSNGVQCKSIELDPLFANNANSLSAVNLNNVGKLRVAYATANAIVVKGKTKFADLHFTYADSTLDINEKWSGVWNLLSKINTDFVDSPLYGAEEVSAEVLRVKVRS